MARKFQTKNINTKCPRCGCNEYEAKCSICRFKKSEDAGHTHNKKCHCKKCKIKHRAKREKRINKMMKVSKK